MFRRKWRGTALALMLCMLFVFAAACTPASTTAGKPDGTTAAPAKTTAAGAETTAGGETEPQGEELDFVEFDWYLGLNEMPDNEMVNDGVNEYLKEKINCNVKIHYWPSSDWEGKMTTMISAGQDVGIIGFGSQSKLDYVVQSNRGAFYGLNDLLAEYGQGTWALFDEAIWESMRIGGNIYGIPSLKDNCYIMSLIYNAEMADALGVDPNDADYRNWRNIEPFLNEVIEKREEMFPEYNDMPLSGGAGAESPYNFAIESFLNDSFIAACNIDPFFDVEGFDADTVFNLYATDDYREYARSRQRMVERNIFAYDYTGKSEWNYTGGMFCWPGWGYTYMQEHLYGDNFTTKMVVSKHIWTDTNNYFSAGTAISANCAVPERAMMLLELVNTDPEFATMMRFGLEEKHYVINNEGKMQFEGSERNGGERADYGYYYWYAAPVGNLTIVNAPESLVGPNGIMLDRIVEYNNSAVLPNHMGFVFNVEPVANEIAACTNVVMEYRDELRSGRSEDEAEVDALVEAFVAKLEANGVQKVVDECQSQIDAWQASR